MNLSNLRGLKGNKRKAKRVGRGIGSGKGGHTVGRGQKGQKTRGKIKLWFEGGQLPLVKRLPQQGGFKSHTRKEYTILSLDFFNKFKDGQKVTVKTLQDMGIKVKKDGVKVLGNGELKKKVKLEDFKFTKSAKERYEKSQ